MIGSRTRLTAVAGSMALTMSLAAAPAVVAQDDPASTIQSFMDAVAAKDFEALPSYFCEAEAEQAAQFDLTELSAGMPEGIDVQSLLDAFIFDIQLDSLEVVSQSDTEAVVQVVGSMAMDIDPEPLMPFIETVIEMSGMEADEDTMNMFMGMMMAEFEAQAEDIDGEVTLVPGEERAWVICSDLDFGDDMAEDMAEDDMADDMSDDDMVAEPTEEPTEEDASE
ncbi:MAG: hypothetical protein PVG27_10295 [Chloroflexota bacterium]|jgi:hypothetical protein